MRLEMAGEVGEGEPGPFLQHHHGAGPLAEPRVGIGDDRHLGDGRMAVEQRLDLDDGDVLAAADDDVLGPAGDAHIARLVEPGEIAGIEPPLRIGGVPFGPFVIAAEIGDAAHQKPPLLARRERPALRIHHLDLRPGQRTAIGLGRAQRRIFGPGQGDRAVFGHAPGRDHPHPQHVLGFFDQRSRNGRPGADEEVQSFGRHARLAGGAGEIGEKRGGGHGETHPLLADDVEGAARFPDIE